MKNNMNLITYIDNPINLSIEQLNFFKSIINQQQKKNSYNNKSLYNEDINIILKELEQVDNREISREETKNNNSNESDTEILIKDEDILDNLINIFHVHLIPLLVFLFFPSNLILTNIVM